MFKSKCSSCGKKTEKKFNFCPYCGNSFKKEKAENSLGMLGRDDIIEKELQPEVKMPFGLDKVMNSLVKQLEKQMSGMNNQQPNTMPKGFKIQISTGKPVVREMNGAPANPQNQPSAQMQSVPKKVLISPEEAKRRGSLKRIEAKSEVRRLTDKVIYVLSVPGVQSEKDVVMSKLENSLEIKAYSKDKCFHKTIPLKVEIIGFYVKKDKLFLELKS
jgi:hypothetical protein